MHYSRSTNGFYDIEIHGDAIPSDAIEITKEKYSELMIDQSYGKLITSDESGYPISIDPQKPTRTKKSLIDDVAEKRWQIETGGVIISGTPIATDRESQAQLTSAYNSLKGGLIADTPWKAADGSFTLVTLAELKPVAQAVSEHVRACFSAEKAHNEAINALENQSGIDEYDINSGWPDNH